MKLKKISIAVGFLLTIAVTWQGSIFFRKPDTVEHHYPTIADAHSDRLFDKGWLPPIIPASSYNITTHNNLDLNTSVGDFSFQKEDLPLFLSHLTPASTTQFKDTQTYRYQQWIFHLSVESNSCRYHLESPALSQAPASF